MVYWKYSHVLMLPALHRRRPGKAVFRTMVACTGKGDRTDKW